MKKNLTTERSILIKANAGSIWDVETSAVVRYQLWFQLDE